MRPPRLLAVVCALALTALVGCGSDDEPGSNRTAAGANGAGEGAKPQGKPLGVAKAKESIDEAVARIRRLIDSEDCEKVNTLNPLAVPALDTDERCEVLRERLDLKVIDAEDFRAGGVIDYEFGEVGASAVTIIDADGRHHVAFIDALLEGESVGSELDKAFDEVADDALTALEDRDCDAFIAVAHRRYGPGAAPDRGQTCEFVENNPIPGVLQRYEEAELVGIGGNQDFAFYGLGAPAVHLTLVLARQEDPRPLPASFEPLPDDASEHAFVTMYVTNRAGAPE